MEGLRTVTRLTRITRLTHLTHLRELARMARMEFLELPRFDGQGPGQWAQLYCTMITPGKKRRIYDQNFKEAAVEMYVNGHRSAPAVARELGICRRSLNLWVKKLNPTAKPLPQSPAQLQGDQQGAAGFLYLVQTT